MILPLTYYGNPLLRRRAKEVVEFTPMLVKLAEDMIETMDDKEGVGLAAPQVGILLRLIVIRPVVTTESGEFALGPPEVYINPVLSQPDAEQVSLLEGCLSIPAIHREVFRPKKIHMEAFDLHGNKVSREFTGFCAREIMHENDHLNGVLFIDRLDKKIRREIEPLLHEIKKTHPFK